MPNKARLVGSGTATRLAWPKIRSLAVAYSADGTTLSELICVPSVDTHPKKFVAELVVTDCVNKPPLIEAEIVPEVGDPALSVKKKKPPIAVGPPPLIVKFIEALVLLADTQTSLLVPTLKKPPNVAI